MGELNVENTKFLVPLPFSIGPDIWEIDSHPVSKTLEKQFPLFPLRIVHWLKLKQRWKRTEQNRTEDSQSGLETFTIDTQGKQRPISTAKRKK